MGGSRGVVPRPRGAVRLPGDPDPISSAPNSSRGPWGRPRHRREGDVHLHRPVRREPHGAPRGTRRWSARSSTTGRCGRGTGPPLLHRPDVPARAPAEGAHASVPPAGREMFGTDAPTPTPKRSRFFTDSWRGGLRGVSLEVNSSATGVPSRLPRAVDGLPRVARRRAVRRLPPAAGAEPAAGPRLQGGALRPCHGGRPVAPRLPLRPVPRPLRRGGGRPLVGRSPFFTECAHGRGLDYYRAPFEFVIPGWAPRTPLRPRALRRARAAARREGACSAIGFAIGVERLLMLLGEGAALLPADVFSSPRPRAPPEAFRRKMISWRRGSAPTWTTTGEA